MRLNVHGLNIRATDAMLAHVHRRFEHALDHVAHAIRSVVLRLKDVNGPKGGVNKRCHVMVELTSGEQLIVEDLDQDVYHVINRAAGRTKRVVNRHLDRRRSRRRSA